MPTPTQETSPAWTNFIDLANDAKPYLQMPAGANPADAQLQGIIDMACWWAQDYLARPIAPTTFFRRFNGWTGLNGAYIMLPYSPILQVLSVVEYRGSSGAYPLSEQIPSNNGSSQDVFQVAHLTGTIIRTFTGLIQRPWFEGSRNIEIEWVAGFNPIPPTFRIGALELVKYWWNNTQQSSRSAVRPAGGGDYGGMIDGPGSLWPAVPNRVAEMFQPYLTVGLG